MIPECQRRKCKSFARVLFQRAIAEGLQREVMTHYRYERRECCPCRSMACALYEWDI